MDPKCCPVQRVADLTDEAYIKLAEFQAILQELALYAGELADELVKLKRGNLQ